MRVTRVIRIVEEADLDVPFAREEFPIFDHDPEEDGQHLPTCVPVGMAYGRKFIVNPGQAHLQMRKNEGYALVSKETDYTAHCEDDSGCTTMTFSDKEV